MHFFRFSVAWVLRRKFNTIKALTSFMSELTTEFFERFGVRILHGSTYHPQSNPVERSLRTLGRILRVLCFEEDPDWEKHVHAALFSLRTVTHKSTGFSPAEFGHGEEPYNTCYLTL
ncbi:hypothetical protein AVEN_267762-1 [Araneus ventricosus]|uniref:Integrase catalytic domain-containing protein n=1 Tax=Araneus ventricosus TaxID=182803 RepID=A0A4Y2QWU9_ARAVE|nr:hypothetical protein AVEN_267762-1 [Araneus ventricosus]